MVTGMVMASTVALILAIVLVTNPEYLAGRLAPNGKTASSRSKPHSKPVKNSSSSVATDMVVSKATHFGADTLPYTDPRNRLTVVMGNVSQVFDVCPKSFFKDGLTKLMENMKWDQISEVMVFDSATRNQVGLAVRTLGQNGKFAYTGDDGKNIESVYYRLKMRPYDRNAPTSTTLTRKTSCASASQQEVFLMSAAVTDIVNVGPEIAPFPAGNNVPIGTFVVRGQRGDPNLLLQLKSLRFTASMSASVKLSNVNLRAEGTEEKGQCILSSLPSIICDSIPESVGIMQGDKRFTVTADVTRIGKGAQLQLQISDFGTVNGAIGSVRWKNDTGNYDWITPTSDLVLGTFFKD